MKKSNNNDNKSKQNEIILETGQTIIISAKSKSRTKSESGKTSYHYPPDSKEDHKLR